MLDRLALMRLLSALLGGVDGAVRLPVPARGAAGAPVDAGPSARSASRSSRCSRFITGGVNPDALLYATSAALFYLLARAFRRGLTTRLALALGAALAVGAADEAQLRSGSLPGAALGAARARRCARSGALRLRALRLPALALGVAALPVLLEMALNATVVGPPGDRRDRQLVRRPDVHPTTSARAALRVGVLPRAAAGGWTRRSATSRRGTLWFNGFVGSFGWVETAFRRVGLRRSPLVPLRGRARRSPSRTLVAHRARAAAALAELLVYAPARGRLAAARRRSPPTSCAPALRRQHRAGALPAAAAAALRRRCSRSRRAAPAAAGCRSSASRSSCSRSRTTSSASCS